MKKQSKLLLIFLMVLSLAGCAQAGGSADIPSQTAAESESSAALPDESGAELSAEAADTPKPEEPAPSAQPEAESSLKELFSGHGMKVGTCLSPQMISTPTVNQLILSQFDSITMENAMKPDYLFNQKKSIAENDLVVEFSKDAIKMLDWARENGLSVRGHTLVWYSQTPAWIFHEGFNLRQPLVEREEMLSRMESFIRQVFEFLQTEGYSDLIYAYDVANEAWMEDGTLRENLWSQTIGDDYLWYAFHYANLYAPENIDLYYNDYNEQFKYEALVEFVDTLKDEDGNYLIDGIGFQAHLYTEDDLDLYFQAVDTLGATGLKLELTELDVCLGSWQHPQPATEENLIQQGNFYYELVKGLFERVDSGALRMDALTFWGSADHLSWRREYSPMLYDKTLTPKYAYYGAMQLPDRIGQ